VKGGEVLMYLTLIQLHKRDAANKQLRDNYTWHQALWEAFPGRPDDNRDFLFRVDDKHPWFRVFLLSAIRPVPQSWGHWQTKQVAETFLNRRQYAFQLKANPTMRRCHDRRRVGICTEAGLRQWMLRKAEQHGFALDTESLVIGAPIEEIFTRGQQLGKHISVDFKGYLTVTDRNSFKAAFEKGIGPAKAFGFGLLMLQPIA